MCPVMDARRNQFYNALFKWENGELIRLTPDRLISAEELAKELSALDGEVYCVGDGYALATKTLRCGNILPTEEALIPQTGRSVALLGEKTYNAADDKDQFTDLILKPGYLRASQAEREKNEKKESANCLVSAVFWLFLASLLFLLSGYFFICNATSRAC